MTTEKPHRNRKKNAGTTVSADKNEIGKEDTMAKEQISESGEQIIATMRGTYVARLEAMREEALKLAKTVLLTKSAIHFVEKSVPEANDLEFDELMEKAKEIAKFLDEQQKFFLESWEKYYVDVAAINEKCGEKLEKALDRHFIAMPVEVIDDEKFDATLEKEGKAEKEDEYENATYSVDGEEMSKEDTAAMKKLTREV